MRSGQAPYPDIGAAAWTVLLRAEAGRAITAETAAGIVGPDLAGEAIGQLNAKHLVEDDRFTPLAETLRRWHPQYRRRP